MTGESRAFGELFNGGVDGAARLVTEYEDQWGAQDTNGVFETGDGLVVCEVTGYAANKDVTTTGIESVFRCYSRICATEDPGKRILAERQCWALSDKVVAPHGSIG